MASGADFNEVRIHTDATAAEMNKSLGAQAFTLGKDIYFNAGKFKPDTIKGLHLLAHELTHTIQQGAVQPKQAADPPESRKTEGKADIEPAPPDILPAKQTSQLDEESIVEPKLPAPEAEPLTEGEAFAEADHPDVATVPSSAEEDPVFQALKARSEAAAEQMKAHQPAGKLSKSAQDAAPSPKNERMSKAKGKQVKKMDAQEAGEFDPMAFKALLVKAIEKAFPKDEKAAEKFPKENELGKVKDFALSTSRCRKGTGSRAH